MDRDTIERAYVPFVTLLRQGGFAPPPEGWTAELVAAHVSRNNDLIADAAERIVAGEQPSYDNNASVDDDELRAYAEAAGGLSGLADATEISARRLAAARSALDATTENCLLPVVITDSGTVVRDEPITIAQLIEGNASFHLDMHFEQLQSLRP
jgi:hypothetical protein